MTLNINKLLIALLAALFLFILIIVGFGALQDLGCANAGPTYTTPTGQDYLELVADPRANTFVQGEVITIVVTNKSDSTIWFPTDNYIDIYLLGDCGELVRELKDLVDRSYAREMLLLPGGDVYSLGLVDALPEITLPEDEAMLFISITGYEYVNGQPTDREIKAGIPVTLH